MQRSRRLSLLVAVVTALATAHAAGTTTADGIAGGRLAARLDLAVSKTTRELPTEPYVRRQVAGIDVLSVTRNTTIPVLHRVAPNAVREVRPVIWEVDVTVVVHRGATLSVRAPIVRELRLVSTPTAFTSIVARSGRLEFIG